MTVRCKWGGWPQSYADLFGSVPHAEPRGTDALVKYTDAHSLEYGVMLAPLTFDDICYEWALGAPVYGEIINA